MVPDEATQCKQIDDLLNQPQQMWLFGAGISKTAGIPLMYPLTSRVETMLSGAHQTDYKSVRALLPNQAHVEHVMSHIGDLIAMASRYKDKKVPVGDNERTLEDLQELHRRIQECIRETVQWGHIPAGDGEPEQIGTREEPMINIEGHRRFVEGLFRSRRAGLERRPPVLFFTTNYDTLLEDALALGRVLTSDGFSGGTVAFWNPERPGHEFDDPHSNTGGFQARLFKLHGSIDWFVSDEDIVVRRRENRTYPTDQQGHLLIYPQASKYVLTRQEPFVSLFSAFRTALTNPQPGVFVVCGYGFGDEHITDEIERAMRMGRNQLTLLAFVKQPDDDPLPADQGFPEALACWLRNDSSTWKDRIVVAGSRGVYHGSLKNVFPAPKQAPHSWWSFEGLTGMLEHGPEVKT